MERWQLAERSSYLICQVVHCVWEKPLRDDRSEFASEDWQRIFVAFCQSSIHRLKPERNRKTESDNLNIQIIKRSQNRSVKHGNVCWLFKSSLIFQISFIWTDLIFSWIFNEYPTFVKQDTRRFISQETGNLYIAKVEPSDVGNYTCVVTNTVTKTRVEGPPTPLVLRSDGESQPWTHKYHVQSCDICFSLKTIQWENRSNPGEEKVYFQQYINWNLKVN